MTDFKTLQFEIIECCKCHCQFCVTVEHYQHLIKSKESFYCPSGHEQSYVGKSDRQIIKELNTTITRCRNLKNETMEDLKECEKKVKAYKMLYFKEKKKTSALKGAKNDGK